MIMILLKNVYINKYSYTFYTKAVNFPELYGPAGFAPLYLILVIWMLLYSFVNTLSIFVFIALRVVITTLSYTYLFHTE